MAAIDSKEAGQLLLLNVPLKETSRGRTPGTEGDLSRAVLRLMQPEQGQVRVLLTFTRTQSANGPCCARVLRCLVRLNAHPCLSTLHTGGSVGGCSQSQGLPQPAERARHDG